jgi:hypothetical protein
MDIVIYTLCVCIQRERGGGRERTHLETLASTNLLGKCDEQIILNKQGAQCRLQARARARAGIGSRKTIMKKISHFPRRRCARRERAPDPKPKPFKTCLEFTLFV